MDFRYVFRPLCNRPQFAIVAISELALRIGIRLALGANPPGLFRRIACAVALAASYIPARAGDRKPIRRPR